MIVIPVDEAAGRLARHCIDRYDPVQANRFSATIKRQHICDHGGDPDALRADARAKGALEASRKMARIDENLARLNYGEAYRLLQFLRMFAPLFPDEVPHTSILREFIGGSTFEY